LCSVKKAVLLATEGAPVLEACAPFHQRTLVQGRRSRNGSPGWMLRDKAIIRLPLACDQRLILLRDTLLKSAWKGISEREPGQRWSLEIKWSHSGRQHRYICFHQSMGLQALIGLSFLKNCVANVSGPAMDNLTSGQTQPRTDPAEDRSSYGQTQLRTNPAVCLHKVEHTHRLHRFGKKVGMFLPNALAFCGSKFLRAKANIPFCFVRFVWLLIPKSVELMRISSRTGDAGRLHSQEQKSSVLCSERTSNIRSFPRQVFTQQSIRVPTLRLEHAQVNTADTELSFRSFP
jgi:hypothetical protein